MDPSPNSFNDWKDFIRQDGFPITLVFYLIYRLDRLMGEVRDTLREIRILIRPEPEKK